RLSRSHSPSAGAAPRSAERTEEEVLAFAREHFGEATDRIGNIIIGDDDDTREMWMVGNGYARLMWPSPRRQRIGRPVSEDEIRRAKRRGKVRVTVCNQERCDEGPFNFGESYSDGSLAKVLKSLEAIRDSIPEPYRAKARCEIDSNSGYEGSHYAHIEVTYERPETDEEWAKRKAELQERIAFHTAKKRQQLERLKAELGD